MKSRSSPLVVAGLAALSVAACQEQTTRESAADAETAATSAAHSAEQAADAAGAAATAAAANAGQDTTTVIREVPVPVPAPTSKEETTSVTIGENGATVRSETREPPR